MRLQSASDQKEIARYGWVSFVVAAAFMLSLASAKAAEYKLYFLGGQSNMEGFGFNAELPDGANAVVPDVMIFVGRMALNDDREGGKGLWSPLQPGYGTGFVTDGETIGFSDRFGPELYFGRRLTELDPDHKFAIVKYALGGSGLSQGVGYGDWHPDYEDGEGINQYDHALYTIRTALAQVDIDGDGVNDTLTPAGIVWMQGEADAHHSQWAADAYRANIQRLMDLLRASLRVDDLPLAIGKITDSGMADDGKVMDYIETVQAAQQDFVDQDSCAEYVTVTDDIAHSDDAWHYDTNGYVRLGAAFAEAIVRLELSCAADPGAAQPTQGDAVRDRKSRFRLR